MIDYPIHPKCSDVREMTALEYGRLLASFKARGYDPAYPIILYDGMILDGRHRYRACRELGIEPTFINWHPIGDDTPALVVLRSLARRHLSKSELAAYAVDDALPEQEEKAAERMTKGKSDPGSKVSQGRAAQIVAEAAGVGRTYVVAAKKLKEEAPEEFDKVKRGEKTLSQAKEDAKPVPPRPTQMKDGAGRPVTEKLVKDALADLPWFEDIERRLHAIKREINEKAETPTGSKLRAAQIEVEIKNAVAAVRFARPYTTCPYRACEKRGCKACGGHRWINRESWDNVPPEIKTANQI